MIELESRYEEGKVPMRELNSLYKRLADEKHRDNHFVIEVDVSLFSSFDCQGSRWKEKPESQLYMEIRPDGIDGGNLLKTASPLWLARQLPSDNYLEMSDENKSADIYKNE